jgi:hypothetical protein
MRPLPLRIGLGDLGSGLAEPETQGPKQPLTLPHPQGDAKLLVQIARQGLAVPEVG